MFSSWLHRFFTLGSTVNEADSSLHGIAILVATIRDVLKVIYGIVELISGVFQAGIITGVLAVEYALLAIEGRLDKVGQAADNAWTRIKRIFSLGLSDVEAGLNGVGQPKTGLLASAKGEVSNTFSAFPHKQTGDGKAESDRAAKEQLVSVVSCWTHWRNCKRRELRPNSICPRRRTIRSEMTCRRVSQIS
jgi:hypothetical protein